MKDFIFISDFDGTITKDDFYKILIKKYFSNNSELENDWLNKKLSVFEFLNKIFTSINVTEAELIETIMSIDFDNYFIEFVNEIENSGGEIAVLSAGSKYYIEKIFESKNINNVKIYSNPGIYKNGGLHMLPDENDKFYSLESGIDKNKAVTYFKTQYKKVYYAGDGPPDFIASKQADIIFARSYLANMCINENINFVPYNDFEDISKYLKQIGVLKYE